MTDIVERLLSSEPLPVCPFDRLSPHYLTMPDDKPCPICGQENTLDGPDKCRGADTRIMKEAANEIDRLRAGAGMAKYWRDQYDLLSAHMRKIRDVVNSPSHQGSGK